jgi:hypothetical protein
MGMFLVPTKTVLKMYSNEKIKPIIPTFELNHIGRGEYDDKNFR